MPDTFIKIASVTVGSGGASSIDFTSIPSTYTDLVIKISARSNRSDSVTFDNLSVKFNSSSTGYTNRMIYGNGSTPDSAVGSTSFISWGYATGNTGVTSNTFGSVDLYIPNYAGSTNKSVSLDSVTENNATSAIASLSAGLWSNTSAITSIAISATAEASPLLLQYSTATLYGIKNS